ncbi:flagellar basal body rod protein FlgC [Chitinimonas sp.]|uniref:flagellar basal body rod protein FlgC n=1 Tax=Chitinimonas sp. TaxID=1934313 RepID=UPI0035B4F6D7
MDYRNAFAISASGMNVEKLRLDVTAVNLANVHSTAGADGKLFQPLRVKSVTADFAAGFDALGGGALHGARLQGVHALDVAPRKLYEPGSPDADSQGFVSLPGVNQLDEMVNLSTALRAYEANVMAMNAAKSMALKALELGGGQ